MGCGPSSPSSASPPEPTSAKAGKSATSSQPKYSAAKKPVEKSEAVKVCANPRFSSLAVAKVTSSQLRAANLVQMFGRRVAAKHKLRRKIRTMQRAVSLHRAQSVRRVVIVSAASGWKIYSELEVFDENQKADVIKFFKDIGLPHTTAIGSPDYPYGASSKLPYQRTIAYLVCAWERWTAPHSCACVQTRRSLRWTPRRISTLCAIYRPKGRPLVKGTLPQACVVRRPVLAHDDCRIVRAALVLRS